MSTATATERSCPSETTLRRFLHDELVGAEAGSIQSHIDSCSVCQALMELLVGTLPDSLAALGVLSATCAVPDTLGPTAPSVGAPLSSIHVPGYEVLGMLGRGGMGVVYKARQMQPERIVALKMLVAGRHAGPKEQQRFMREAGAVAQLQHPYIVSLYEAGQHGELPYLTLEFVTGGSLADLLRTRPLSPRNAARLVEQLARGTHYAHERGIVHRDLKPANVLLQIADLGLQNDSTGVSADPDDRAVIANLQTAIPKITDFGLAKSLAGSSDLTSANAVCGTPSYMAPEQARGDAKAVGVGADVYALGAILYECLTGRPPFRGPTPADTLLQVITQDPVPPSRLQHTVPRDLQTICLKCLQKKPHQRYASALELAEDLHRFQAGEAIRARPVGRIERIVKWCRRRPGVAALVATVILVTILAGALVTWQWREAVTALAEARSEKAARAQRQVAALPDAAPGSVPAILEDLEASRDEVLPLLRRRYQEETDQLRRMRLALALLPVDAETIRVPLTDWLLHAPDPAEVLLAREALRSHQAQLIAPLWAKADDPKTTADERFRAWVALAAYDPDNSRWEKLGPEVVEQVLWANPLHRRQWSKALRPIQYALLAPMTDASYYPLRLGTKWHGLLEQSGEKKIPMTLQVGKIESIDGQALARLEAVANGELVTSEHLSTNAKGLFRHRYNGTEVSPPIRLLNFPIRIGESWESTHKSGEQTVKVKCRIASEEVEVPAGKYTAVVLHMDALVGKASFTTSYWFVADVGLVKQRVVNGDTTTTFSLEKFESGLD